MQAKFVGRWVASGNNMKTGYPGSSFSFRVSGTSYVNVSISGATRIAYKVDDGDYVVTNNVKITGLTLSTHKIKIVLTTSIQTWAGNNYAQVTGIEVANGGTVTVEPAMKRKCLVFGDSITEGYGASNQNISASECAWWNVLGDVLNMDVTPVGIGGIGYVKPSNTYPAVKNIPSYIENITNTDVFSDVDYDLVIIELGTNDGELITESGFANDVISVVNRIKAKYTNAEIHALIPFSLYGESVLTQAYSDTNINIIPKTWYPEVTFISDRVHPDRAGNSIIANNIKSYFLTKYGESYFKEVVMKRIDTIYIDTSGSVQKVTGTMADNPVKPALPVGSIRIADVLVDEGATTGDIQDSRALLTTADKNILISPNVGQINNIVFLSRYESITEAIADIDNKVLVIDVNVDESNEILIDTHSNFVICSDLSKNIDASLKFVDCSNFRINNLKISGTNNYKTFYIFSSNNFIIDGLFINGTQSRQHEGLHIFACLDFKVINNTVQFSALDSILIHSECYNFVVSNNIVREGGAIGIEIEGRTDGSQTDPQYSRCHHGTISNNVIDAEWNAILCLFSDDINITGNNCKNSINIAGSTNTIVTGNTVKYRGYGLQIGVELFTFDKAGNYCKNITVTGNSFYGTTGVLAGNYYGWDGIVTVRGVENFIFTSNIVMFVGSSGIDNKVSYLSLFDVDFATIANNVMEPTDHGYIPYFGIKLVDRTTEYATQATIKKGLYNVKIKDNVIRHAYWGIGVDVYNCLSASDKASNFYNIDIDNNTLYNCTQIALTLMLIDNSCYIKLGKNAIHNSKEAVNTYLSEARLTSSGYQAVNSCQSSMDIPISQTALYEPGDTIYNPSTTVAYQVCVASGTPGTWKSVALS